MKKAILILTLALIPMSCAQPSSKLAPEQKEKIRQHFDKDGDGKLNAAERAAAKQALIKRLDRNGDGKVDADERAAAKNRMQ